MPNAGFETRRILQRELAPFHKQNPDIEVHLTIIPWFFAWDRLMAVAKKRETRDPPDVIQIGSTWNATLAALGALLDLTDLLGGVDRSDIVRPAWNYCYDPSRARVHSLPWFLDARVLYYRRDILEKLGIPPAELGTWKGFRQACERLRDHPRLGKRYFALVLAGQKEGILIHDLAPWVWGSGGNFLNVTRQFAQFHEGPALRGIDFYCQMMSDRLIPLAGRDRLSTGNFFSGQFAFQFSGAWPIRTLFNSRHPDYQPEVARNYGIAVCPAGPAGQVTYLGGSHLAIASLSPHPEAAWKLIRYLTDGPSQARHSRDIGMLPSLYSALEQFLAEAPSQVAEVFRHSLRIARTLPSVVTLGTVERILGRVSQRLMDAVRDNRYSSKLLAEEMSRSADEADYILSLYD